MSMGLDPCRVHAPTGELVAEGFVREHTSSSILVEAEHFSGQWFEPGEPVVAQVMSALRGQLTYDAVISSSEARRIELVDLRLRDSVQQRSAVRVPTSLPVRVTQVVRDGVRAALDAPLDVTVVDLSAGGARVSAAEELEPGTGLLLPLAIGRAPMTVLATVLRSEPLRTSFLHGCRFDDIREREMDEIFAFVMAEQRRQRALRLDGA